jgi:parallel beta-helix repeat protein
MLLPRMLAVVGALVGLSFPAVAQVELRPGMVITQSTRILPKTYRLAAPASLDSALITIRGDDVTVDFQGATLEGMPPETDPDRATGVAIRVEGGRNVRILNARIRGYRVGILARRTQGLALIGNDVSYTWKPRLFSLVEHESLVDWLSYHHNENNEWLRYGAAIYLDGVEGGDIRSNTAVGGMNGLLLARSKGLAIRENNFSFNSGLGIGLYRSTEDTIIANRIDYNVRGYSHRFYRRGQDSAGLLMFEQSSRNVVAANSVTHGGDGLFLWAGQTAMDSGTTGANDNVFYDNDFSFAPANGMEATFSRNKFVANRAVGSDYGLWGGYSYSSLIERNDFADNRWGIAIEHGQDNVIRGNRFLRDSTAIRLWADSIEPSEWGYPKHHDTRSRDYAVDSNVFVGNRVAVRARNTRALVVTGNRLLGVDTVFAVRDSAGFREAGNLPSGDSALAPVRTFVSHNGPPSSDLTRRDRSAIIVDEWGPYDWLSPKLWPVDSSRAVPLRLAVLGPAGTWRVVTRRGVAAISRTAGSVGDTILVTPAPSSVGDWEVTLEYRGSATVSPRGVKGGVGRMIRFSYGRFEPPIDWTTKFFTWTDTARVFDVAIPAAAPRGARLDYMWYRPTLAGLPLAHWSLDATGTVTLAPGTYTIRTISDDAVRVWVDSVLVIDHWTPHESMVDFAPLTGGRHELRVAYYQVDGWTELRVDIVRGVERSTGSPGQH